MVIAHTDDGDVTWHRPSGIRYRAGPDEGVA